MASYTILDNDSRRRICLVPTQMPDSRWTYRVTERNGTDLPDEEPHFPPTATREECERNIEAVYLDAAWGLRRVEGA